MTMPKGFKPKVNKKEKEEKSKVVTAKEDNNIDSNDIKVSATTADDFINKQENKIVTENISHKQEVTVDDIGTPTPEGEVQSETELKVMSSPSSSSFTEAIERPIISSSTKSIEDYPENKKNEEKEQMQNIIANRVLDEAKDNLRRHIDEAKREIPRYTQAVNDYQEQIIQVAREIADTYIESQKEIINSLQSIWWTPYIENMYGISSNWLAPRRMAEMYTNTINTFADNIIAATRLANNMMFANMEAFKTSMQQAKGNAKELSRIGVNAARSFGQTSRSNATTTNFPP